MSFKTFARSIRATTRRLLIVALAVLAMNLVGASETPLLADVNITFQNDGPNLKMTYSGSVTGSAGTGGLGAPNGAFVVNDYILVKNVQDSFDKFFPVSPSSRIFGSSSVPGGTISGSSTSFLLFPGTIGLRLSNLSGGPRHEISGEVVFAGKSVNDLGNLITPIYEVTGTTGGTNGAPDRIIIQVLRGPTVTLSSNAPDPVGGAFEVSATFSAPVSGFDESDITVTNGTASEVKGSGSSYTFTITPNGGSGTTSTVVIRAGVVTDGNGNGNAESNVVSRQYVDAIVPSVVLSGPSSVAGPFTLTATFSEPITGLDISDFTVGNATVSGLTEVTPNTVYTVELTPVMGTTVTASIAEGTVQDAAGNFNTASNTFTALAGSPKTAFNQYKDDIKRIIQDQAEKRLTTLMNDNGRMMQDARTRFIGFVSGSNGTQDGSQMGLLQNGFDAIALDVNGTADVSGDLNGIVAASSGEFLGQTGMVNGANWRLSGNFDVLLDGDQNLASFDARVAREQFLARNVLWGAFGGGQFSNSDISDSFSGSETTWQLYGGTYAVGKLTSNLFADAYASLGYGWSDLNMANDVLGLESNYGTFTWQVGGSLAGLIEMERFSLLPTVSLAYGNSNLGEIDFTAQAYGLTDGVSLDADYVAMGVLRLTPEVRIPLGANATEEDGVVLGLLPSFICQQVVVDESETDCGWGVGAELTQAGSSGIGQFNGRLDFEQIGGISRIGGQIGYSIAF